MEDPNTKTDAVDVNADLKAEVENLKKEKADLAAKTAEAAERNRSVEKQLDVLTGQLSVLTAAATGGQPETKQEDIPTDIINEPEKVLEYHFNKRTRPLIDQQLSNNISMQKDMIAIKRKEDWGEFGPAVEALIVQGRISKEQLAQPGTYENLLDFVKAKNLEKIVEKKVKEGVAAFQESAARAAGSSPNASGVNPDKTVKKDPELTDEEILITKKLLGGDSKAYADVSSKTLFDGVRYRGEVAH